MTTPCPRIRWAARLGWLLVVGPLVVALTATNGSMSEQQLIDASLYVVLPFAFGIGMLVASRKFHDVPTGAAVGVMMLGTIFAAVAMAARWFFFATIF